MAKRAGTLNPMYLPGERGSKRGAGNIRTVLLKDPRIQSMFGPPRFARSKFILVEAPRPRSLLFQFLRRELRSSWSRSFRSWWNTCVDCVSVSVFRFLAACLLFSIDAGLVFCTFERFSNADSRLGSRWASPNAAVQLPSVRSRVTHSPSSTFLQGF